MHPWPWCQTVRGSPCGKILDVKRCLTLPRHLSLSLSLSHTHTHTHSLSPTLSFSLALSPFHSANPTQNRSPDQKLDQTRPNEPKARANETKPDQARRNETKRDETRRNEPNETNSDSKIPKRQTEQPELTIRATNQDHQLLCRSSAPFAPRPSPNRCKLWPGLSRDQKILSLLARQILTQTSAFM